MQVTDAMMAVNYGLDRVRFPAPLPVGAQWRGGAEIVEVTEIPGGAADQVSGSRSRSRTPRSRPAWPSASFACYG